MKSLTLILFLILTSFGSVCSQTVKDFTGSLDSVNTILGHTFDFGDDHQFTGNTFYKNQKIDSLSVKYEDEGYFEDIDANYRIFHQYFAKFNSTGSLNYLEAKYFYSDGIDIFVDYHFNMSSREDTTNLIFSGSFGHIMPDTTLHFKIDPFNFEEALDKVGNWWNKEFETNRSEYLRN